MQANYYFPAKLPGIVRVIWEQRSDAAASWMILPSGYVELIFRLGPALGEVQGTALVDNPTRHFCFLSGLHTRPLRMSFTRFHFIGVQMSPVAVRALFGMPCAHVRNGSLEGALIMNGLDAIEDRLHRADSFQDKARWLEDELLRRIDAASDLTMALRLNRGLASLPVRPVVGKHLLSFLGYSRGHAHRVFQEWLGQPPAEHLQLLRFVRALRLLHAGPVRLAAAALEAGYYDQPHFVRSFYRFAGLTPGEYRQRMTAIPGQCPG
jgi:AraC-like DNA-binding protein